MLNRLRTYSRFVKLEHSVFALPLVFAGALIASGGRPWMLSGLPALIPWHLQLVVMVIAAIGARTIAFALNRIFDSKIDGLNPRTLQRELPAGKMTLSEAIGVGLAGVVIYFGAAILLLGGTGIILGVVPLVVFTIYPLLKRFTSLAHFGVGLSLALAPLAGWFALFWNYGDEEPRLFDPELTLLYHQAMHQIPFLVVFTFFWVSGFDIIYSTMDEDFDRSQGLHSLPARFGRKNALWISAALHAAAFVSLAVLYVSYFRTPVAGVVLGATGVLLFLEQYLAENVDLAFFKINGIISFLILAFIWTGVAHL